MNLINKLDFGRDLVLCKIFGRKKPLIVSFSITERCNADCDYCDVGKNDRMEEYTSTEAMALLKELETLGMKKVIFTGGEPLLRKDIGSLISKASELGISVNLNTNGLLVPEKIGEISDADLLVLSLDGPKEINDSIRSKRTHDKVMKSIEMAKEYDIEVGITSVLSSQNIDKLDYLFNVAKDKQVPLNFQPVVEQISSRINDSEQKSIKNLVVERGELRGVIKKIKKFKMNNKNLVKPSIYTLDNMLDVLFSPKKPDCGRGIISYRIEKRSLVACSRCAQAERVSMENGFKEAMDKINTKPNCSTRCCTGALELSNIWNFNFKTMLNQIINGSY